MPKLIGNSIPGATQIEDNASPEELVKLSYSQARLLPVVDVVCSLDTTDRGSKGSYASSRTGRRTTPPMTRR